MRYYNKDAGFDVGLTVLLPIFFLITSIIISLIFIFVVQYQKKQRLNRPNLMFLELDLKQWRIKKIPMSWSRITNQMKFSNSLDEIINNGWIDINKFFTILNTKEVKKWKKAIEYAIQNKTSIEITSVIDLDNYNLEKSNWQIEFFPPYNDVIRINIKWYNSLNYQKNQISVIEKEQLLTDKVQFKLFVAFSLTDKNINLILNDFLVHFQTAIKIKKIKYFIFKNNIVFVASAWQFDQIQKIKAKFTKYIYKNKNNIVFNSYYDALTYVEVKSISTEEDFAKILTRISFGIIKSKLIRKPFYFSSKEILFNEFEEYKEAINYVNDLLVKEDFVVEKQRIYSILQNKKVLNYFLPKINEMPDNNWFPLILSSSNFQDKLSDLFFKKMINYNNEGKLFMIDINDYEINARFDEMIQNRKILYIINLVSYKKPLQIISLFKLLKKYQIKFGIRVNEITSVLFSIVENVKPNVLIMSKEFTSSVDPDLVHQNIDKIGLILICERLNIIPIFENPDHNLKITLKNFSNKEKYFFQTNYANISLETLN